MTPKEKAESLFLKFIKIFDEIDCHHSLGQEALNSADYLVDEILEALNSDRIIFGSEYQFEENKYWQDVKYELTQLDTLLL